MKTILIVIISMLAGLGLGYLIIKPVSSPSAAEAVEKQQYTCGMHPQIISDQPGYCPLCGMKLVPKRTGSEASGGIVVDPLTVQNMGIVVAPVRRGKLSRQVRASGQVAFSEPDLTTVTVKFSGWIEKLYVDHAGAAVQASQPLVEIYSPELVTAQQELLIAHQAHIMSPDATALTGLLEAARLRLKNWDISDDQIERLLKEGTVQRTLTLHAPADGVVVSKNVAVGDEVGPGMVLYRLADLSQVWVKAYIYEQDLPFISVSQKAEIAVPNLSNEKFHGEVIYISPYLDEGRRAEIRLVLDNPGGQLKPDTYAEVTLETELPGARLLLPRSAVVNSGTRQLVFVEMGSGKYEARRVETGAAGDHDLIEIISGLQEGEKVVVSGQFMLDSETRLSEALETAGMPGHDSSKTAPGKDNQSGQHQHGGSND